MAAMVSMIPSALSEEAALYMVMLYCGSEVEMIKTGYNSMATRISKKLTVNAEKINAIR